MRISDWSSDVCSSDLTWMKLGPPYANVAATGAGEAGGRAGPVALLAGRLTVRMATGAGVMTSAATGAGVAVCGIGAGTRSEEHTSELQSLMRISYAVFCLKKKNRKDTEQKSDT